MLKDDLKCVLIGRELKIYRDLAKLVRKIDPSSRFKQVELKERAIVDTLKKISGPSLIFISDEVPFSLELLSDLTWQYNSDSIVVILTTKAKTVSIKELFNNTQFSRINLKEKNSHRVSILQFLIKSTREKTEFRRCKSLLGISEKRCQWLVDSSREAIAFISRDMHLYANATYLQLFEISSIQELRSISVKDIIVNDEHLLFDGFQKNQGKPTDKRRSIMLSMKKKNNALFRANIYLIPSVFKGQKCYQLWVRNVNDLSSGDKDEEFQTDDPILNKIQSSKPKIKTDDKQNPFSSLLSKHGNSSNTDKSNSSVDPKGQKQTETNDNVKQNNYDQNSLLRGVIRRKEAKVIASTLRYLKENESKNKKIPKHKLLSLKVATAQKKGVDDLLMKLPDSFDHNMRAVFWDKVKLSRILQALIKKDNLNMQLMLRINEASVMDDAFIDWLTPGLQRLGENSRNLVFLVPSNINENQYKRTLLFIQKIRKLGCKVALDSFSINKKSMILLKYSKPNYLKLSLPWTRQLQGNEAKEIRLSSAIRQFENKNIKVIAPCDFSKDMKKLFVLSGASFCQERAIKAA